MKDVDLPELLSAASQSPLGLLALVVIAVSVIALIFFWQTDIRVRVSVFAALLVGAASFAIAVFKQLPAPPVQPLAETSPTFTPPSTATRPDANRLVLTLDRNNDHIGSSPGNLFDGYKTAYMRRSDTAAGMWTADGGGPYHVGWLVRTPQAGRYQLSVRYASEEPRPTEVRLDNQTLFTALGHTTGSWTEAAWFVEGTVELHEGLNHLWFHREQPPPNIDAVRLTKLEQQ